MGAADPLDADADAGAGAAAQAAPAQTAVVDFRCDQCGAPLAAKAGADALECAHCGHTQPILRKVGRIIEYDFQAALRVAPRGAAADLATGAREVECKGCGARTVTAGQSSACPFCGSPLIPDLKAGDKLMLPESLLPHKVTRDQAKDEFKRWLRTRWFAPNDLVRRAKTTGLDGVMLPHWTYDSETSTSYMGLRGDHYWETESYTDSDGKTQTRTVQKTRWTSASGTVHVSFDDVLVCASRSLPAKLVQELEPWDLEALQPFDPAYLAGHVTERYQIDLQAGFDLAAERMRPRIRRAIEADIGGDVQQILSMDVTHRDVKFKHLLLPLWISSFRYGERVFRVMVNARTGEVQGERPWSAIKILLFTLFVVTLVIGGVWLYERSQEPSADDDYQPPPTTTYEPGEVPAVPAPTLPVLPVVVDPLGRMDALAAEARLKLPGAVLTGMSFMDVDADGTARGAAGITFRAASTKRGAAGAAGAPCAIEATLSTVGASWQASTTGCDAPALLPPTCSLAEVMARLPADRPVPEGAPTRVVYQVAAGAVPAEAPVGATPSPRAARAAVAGEWRISLGGPSVSVTIADDCHPRPAPPAPPTGPHAPGSQVRTHAPGPTPPRDRTRTTRPRAR
ncbi:MAG TPA: hypothetical protein VHE35_07070 [Kofleriaceae bacterium]|nr:hypothetical protein [Kofleriaceae bacterium]